MNIESVSLTERRVKNQQQDDDIKQDEKSTDVTLLRQLSKV